VVRKITTRDCLKTRQRMVPKLSLLMRCMLIYAFCEAIAAHTLYYRIA
jgi:hypothetical protein